MNRIKMYYWLAKPGIVLSNTLGAMAGFFFACALNSQLNLRVFLGLVVGICLVIASACVLNNYFDRHIDRAMKRTKGRPTATGDIAPGKVIAYAAILGILGFGILILFTNLLTALLGLTAYFAYIVLYGIAKRTTTHSTLIGTVSGALPPVAGYVAVTNSLDVAALLLFLIMVCWQMPHFYAIGIRRRDEYARAKLPVLPVVKGVRATKIQMLLYIAAFAVFNELLVALDYTGYVYLIVLLAVSAWWFIIGIRDFDIKDDKAWAGKMFGYSLVVLLVFFGMVSVGPLLP